MPTQTSQGRGHAVTTYDDALAFLHGRINYERHPSGDRADFRLDRMRRLLARLGDPQDRIPAVHVGGTKGKGSTAAMTAAALVAAGRRVGLYTSPHLERFEERMTVDGEEPTPGEFVAVAAAVAAAVLALEADEGIAATYFETATAMAWELFARREVDVAVLEVGLGGRLDATTVCRPDVVAITNVSRDHTALLGDTPAEIAFEKAGIVKPGVPVVSGVTDPDAAAVLRAVCRERSAPLCETAGRYAVARTEAGGYAVSVETPAGSWGPLAVPLAGRHQADNAATAVLLLSALAGKGWDVGPGHAADGWRRLGWPARIEVVSTRPTVVLDAAHNWAAAGALARTLADDLPARRRVLLFAGSREKDLAGMLSRLVPVFDSVVLTEFRTNPRACPVEDLERLWRSMTDRPAHAFARSDEAFAFCRRIAGPDDLICVTGSFFLAAEVRPLAVPR